jgi:hypothetical protein
MIHFAYTSYVGSSDCGLRPVESAEQRRINSVLTGTATSSGHASTNVIGSWRLKMLSRTPGGDTVSLGRLTLDVSNKGGFFVTWTCPAYHCKTQLNQRTVVFSTIVVAPGPTCGPPNYPTAVQRQDQFTASVLDGAVNWWIDRDILTITSRA